jgi:hypothetical protein
MRKIISALSIGATFLLSSMPAMAAKPNPACTTIKQGTLADSVGNLISLGYDQWGYNYEAHMFNGWYDNYSRPIVPVTEGDVLMMKWNDSWLSNVDCDGDGKLDRHYGFPTYRGSGAWLTNHASGTYESTALSPWVVSGDFVIPFEYLGGYYNHDLSLTDTDGVLTGNGGYPNGGPYSYWWDITTGSISGDTISWTAIYSGGLDAVGTIWNVSGTIADDGSITGTWNDDYSGGYREGTWALPAGTATKTAQSCTWSDFVKIVAAPTDADLVEDDWQTSEGVEIGPSIWGDFAIIQEVSENPCGEDLGLLNYKSDLRSGLGNW